jgi:hypothetical protein
MHSFITSCPELLTEDIVRRLTVPLEAALNLLTLLSGKLRILDNPYQGDDLTAISLKSSLFFNI